MLIFIKAATLLKGDYEQIIIFIFQIKNDVCIIPNVKEAFLNAPVTSFLCSTWNSDLF